MGGFLAGAYIAFGGLVAIAVSSGLKPETWGTLPTLFAGSVFALGLVLVVLAGSELLTGNMALVPIAMMKRRVGLRTLGQNFTIVLIGNLIGSLFVAYFLAVQTGRDRHERRRPGVARRHDLRAAEGDRGAQGRHRGRRPDLPARARLQLARLPRGLGRDDRRGHRRQDPRDLLPDHGLRRDRLRPRRGEHVLPARGDLRRGARHHAGATRSTTGPSRSSGTSSARRSSCRPPTGSCTCATHRTTTSGRPAPSRSRPQAGNGRATTARESVSRS